MLMREYVQFVIQMQRKTRSIFCLNVHVIMILVRQTLKKLKRVVKNHFIYVAKFIVDAMKRRKSILYN